MNNLATPLLSRIIFFCLSTLDSRGLRSGLIFSFSLSVAYSYYFLSHSVDDIFYFGAAMNFAKNSTYAIYVGNELFQLFYLFPTFSILNGIFIDFLETFSISITYINYRLFSKLILIALIISVIYYVHINTDGSFLAQNLAILIFLTSPFMIGSIGSVRPEPFGALCVCWGLIFFSLWKIHKTKKNLFLSVFFLGLACTTHPIFIVPAILISLHIANVCRKAYKDITYIGLLFVMIAPLALYLSWLLMNFEQSAQELSNRIANPNSSFDSMLIQNIYTYISSPFNLLKSSLPTGIYRLYFTYPFIIIVLVITYILIFNYKVVNSPELSIGFTTSLINFAFIPHHDFHYALLVLFVAIISSVCAHKYYAK
ncbi:hypothetical protein N9A24_02675 [Gammaproteobacteria bacterium]|nr:hypothetical protein [Gammaproteobacteria bacterium]